MAVPSDIEPTSIIDLVDDCREVSSVLAPYVIDLTKIPTPRSPLPFQVPAGAAEALAGYDYYGS
ncbi:MAG: hypothetical protein LC789_04090 [Actinobacteria bacterium]|nr:hypothetical protein [Actinomycetota bacterium]